MNRISIKVNQLAILLSVAIIARRVIIAPAIMFFNAGKDGYISYIVLLFVNTAIIAAIAYVIKKNPGKSFNEVCKKHFGPVVTKVLLFILFIFYIHKILVVDNEMQNFLLEAIYYSINWDIFIIPIFLVIAYLVVKGPRVMGRISLLFFPLLIFVVIYTFIMCVGDADFSNLLPVLENGIKPVLKGIVYGFAQTGEFIFLFMFMEHIIDKKKKIVKYLTITAVITYLSVIAFYLIFVSIFGEAAIILKEGVIRITQFSPSLASNFRIDGITTVLWLPSCIILSAVLLYSAAKAFQNLFNFKKIVTSVLIALIIVAIITFLPSISSQGYFQFSLKVFVFIFSFVQLLIPFSLFFVTLFKRRKEKN